MKPLDKNIKKSGIYFSLKWQYTLIFAGLTALIIGVTIALSSLFLPKYYEYKKLKTIESVYADLRSAYSDTSSGDSPEELFDEMDNLSMRNSLSIIILNEDSDIIYSSKNLERDIDMILVGYIFGFDTGSDIDVIEQSSDHIIRRTQSHKNDYLELFGRLDNGMSFLVRTPIESIGLAASYANRFYLIIGIAGIVFGSFIIFFLSKRISAPILKLNDISSRMVDLDFEARFEGKTVNEIGLLGENMNRMSDSLEKSISELKTANNELKRDIEKKEKAAEEHSEFISNVSHELKTPISLIQGYAEGLKEGVSDDPESRDYYLDVIIDEASKMNRMVRELLNLDQLESGDDVIDMERFDMYEVVSNYLQSAAVLIDESGAVSEFDEKKGAFVWGDPYKAETVFANYLTNAIHYCREVKGTKLIRTTFENRGNILRVSVFNTGDPISEDVLGRVWDKFYKADPARTREYGGSGVGLSIVKAIQTSIGREYGVYNTEDGVVFWFDMESGKRRENETDI